MINKNIILIYLSIMLFTMNQFLPDSNYEWIESEGKQYYTYTNNTIGFPGSDKEVTIRYYVYTISVFFMISITALLAYFNTTNKLIKKLMVIICTFFSYMLFEWVIWRNDVDHSIHVIFITIVFILLALRDSKWLQMN